MERIEKYNRTAEDLYQQAENLLQQAEEQQDETDELYNAIGEVGLRNAA